MQPTYEELLALFIQSQILVEQLRAEIIALKAEIKDLKDKLNTNSSNSSKPPSQDPFRAARKAKRTGRKQGAQPGHSGHRRNLYPLENVQTVVEVKPNECPNCLSTAFDKDVISTEIRQVVELPESPPDVTQYNIHTCRCVCCSKHVKANVPSEAQYGFGPRLMGFITTLSGEFRLSKRQVAVLLGKINIRICSGTVCKIHERASQILKEPYDEIKKHTLRQVCLNADESGWKTITKKRWIWIGHGKDSVFFDIKTSRSSKAFQEVFEGFSGSLITDRYGAYNTHEGPQQLCWSHGNRDFEKISGRGGIDELVGKSLLDCKAIVFGWWHRFKDGHITRDELIKGIEAGPKEDLRMLLKIGVMHEDSANKTKATCADFLSRFDSLWIFVYKEGVEPTNNVAERGLRHAVIWRKLSHGSQSEIGERFVERIMTVAMTLKLQAKNTFEYFTECFKRYIFGGTAPPIFS